MNRPTIDARFYETYQFVFAIKNILEDQFSYLRSLDGFYGDYKYLHFVKPFQPFSAFHEFLEFILDELITDTSEKFDIDNWAHLAEQFESISSKNVNLKAPLLPIELALHHHGYQFESFGDWLKVNEVLYADASQEDIYDYLNELRRSGPYDDLLLQTVREAFFLLFANRHVLMLFNDMIARQISDTPLDEVPEEYAQYFAKSGVLKRPYLPEWVKRAVFYRDRGLCVSCKVDLSGILNIWTEDHFDHIVPLESGGLNDVTNIQLLCATCNIRKGAGNAFTSNSYEDWYPLSKEKINF